MDYFKHYSTASDGESMNRIFDRLGHKGIAFWWMLTELCAENWDGKSQPEFSFHPRLVATKLKTRSTLVQPFLELCSNLGMGKFEVSETKIEICIPNLKEIKDSKTKLKSNQRSKIPRIEKEEEKEEELDKDKEGVSQKSGELLDLQAAKKGLRLSDHFASFDEAPKPDDRIKTLPAQRVRVDQVIQLFNDTLAGKAGKISFCHGLSSSQLQDFITTSSFENFSQLSTWVVVFELVKQSPFLTGIQEGISFTATLSWLVQHSHALDVLNGKYPAANPKQFAKKAFGLGATESNPTGNPYLNEGETIEVSLEC